MVAKSVIIKTHLYTSIMLTYMILAELTCKQCL